MDNSHVALVSLELKKDAFSEFRCDRDTTLGMNLTSLTKIIKCANNDDNCKLTAVEDADSLSLQFQGKSTSRPLRRLLHTQLTRFTMSTVFPSC